jgi:hypothetical protein
MICKYMKKIFHLIIPQENLSQNYDEMLWWEWLLSKNKKINDGEQAEEKELFYTVGEKPVYPTSGYVAKGKGHQDSAFERLVAGFLSPNTHGLADLNPASELPASRDYCSFPWKALLVPRKATQFHMCLRNRAVLHAWASPWVTDDIAILRESEVTCWGFTVFKLGCVSGLWRTQSLEQAPLPWSGSLSGSQESIRSWLITACKGSTDVYPSHCAQK